MQFSLSDAVCMLGPQLSQIAIKDLLWISGVIAYNLYGLTASLLDGSRGPIPLQSDDIMLSDYVGVNLRSSCCRGRHAI